MVFAQAAPTEVPLDGVVQQAHDCATQIAAPGEELPHAMGNVGTQCGPGHRES